MTDDATTPEQPRTAAARRIVAVYPHLWDGLLEVEAQARPAVASEGLRALITDESRYNLTDYGRGWNDAIRAALELDVPLVTDEELSTSVGWGALASDAGSVGALDAAGTHCPTCGAAR